MCPQHQLLWVPLEGNRWYFCIAQDWVFGRRRENFSTFLFFMPAGRRKKFIFQKFIFNFFKNKLVIVVLSQGAESKKTQFFETT